MAEVEGGIENMSLGFKTYGCHALEDGTFVARQWAPGAEVPNTLCAHDLKFWMSCFKILYRKCGLWETLIIGTSLSTGSKSWTLASGS